MKKTLLTLALVAVTAASFAQGKISMVNDANHAIAWGSVKAGDTATVGSLVDGLTPLGASLTIDLYGGTTAGNLTLQQSTTMSTGGLPGIFGPRNFISPNLAGGVVAFMQIQIRESTFATAAAAQAGNGYYGYSSVFNFTPSATIAYANLAIGGGSTWAPGNVLVQVNQVPEPTSMALAGLGAASLLIFRRRK